MKPRVLPPLGGRWTPIGPAVAALAVVALGACGFWATRLFVAARATGGGAPVARAWVVAVSGVFAACLAVGVLLAGRIRPGLRRRARLKRGRTVLQVARAHSAGAPVRRVAVGGGPGPWLLGAAGVRGVDAVVPTAAPGPVARLRRLAWGWQIEALDGHHVYGPDGIPCRCLRLDADSRVRVADIEVRACLRGGGERVRRRSAAFPLVRVDDAGEAHVLAGRVVAARGVLGRAVGLLGRDRLDPEEGLWIEPCSGVHALFMRIAIDAVYLDREGRVVAIQAPLRPWRVGPVVRDARVVVELAEGSVGRLGIAVGDRLAARRAPSWRRA